MAMSLAVGDDQHVLELVWVRRCGSGCTLSQKAPALGQLLHRWRRLQLVGFGCTAKPRASNQPVVHGRVGRWMLARWVGAEALQLRPLRPTLIVGVTWPGSPRWGRSCCRCGRTRQPGPDQPACRRVAAVEVAKQCLVEAVPSLAWVVGLEGLPVIA